MITLFEAARDLQSFCEARGWRSCFIGGLAVQRWGQARVTRDIDVTLITGFGGETPFVEALLGAYAPRISNAGEFALRSRVLLLQTPGGVGIDISLGALPFEELVVQRATPYEFAPGLDLRTCSGEDLIVLKRGELLLDVPPVRPRKSRRSRGISTASAVWAQRRRAERRAGVRPEWRAPRRRRRWSTARPTPGTLP